MKDMIVFLSLCEILDVTPELIKSSSRKTKEREARQIICYVLRETVPGITLVQIGKHVNRDHTTVIHSIRAVSDEMKYNARLDERVSCMLNSSMPQMFARSDSVAAPRMA